MSTIPRPFGELLRTWRRRRRLSQLALASEAQVSQRHLSFVESGRASPSRDMVLRLSDQLSIPLRERNLMLVAAGYAPAYGERAFDHPDLAAARRVVERILAGHEPYPALAVDRHWYLLAANGPATRLLAGADDPALWAPPVNVLRLSLHPRGLAPRIANYREWRHHLLARLAALVERTADPVLAALHDELRSYPVPVSARPAPPSRLAELAGLALPLELDTEHGVLSLLSTTTVFGTPMDVSLAELAIEAFFPADAATTEAMRGW